MLSQARWQASSGKLLGTRTRSSLVLEKRTTLGSKYRFGEELGRGTFGVVHKGININSGQFVAIKTVQNIANAKHVEEVHREMKLLHMLDSPWIVKYYDYFQTEDTLNIVLEYVEGGSLRNIITKYGVFPESLTLNFTSQILLGLKELHSKGIIHTDIKCGNILITKEGVCKIADFGTSVIKKERSQTKRPFVGSSFWMAPELLTGDIQPSVDIWALGCTIVEMLTGKPPYWDIGPMAAMFRISEDKHPPIPENISDDLEHFLHCCFQKDISLRYRCEELLQHPWIQKNSARNARSVSVSEMPDVLSSLLERKLTNDDLESYRDASILGGDFDEEIMGEILETLDSQEDPSDLISLLTDESLMTDMDVTTDEANLSTEELLKLLQQSRDQCKTLRNTCSQSQKQIGYLLNEKKKATTIAKKFQKHALTQEMKCKEAVAKLQAYKEHNKRYEGEKLVSLRRTNAQLESGHAYLMEQKLVDISKLVASLCRGSLAVTFVRLNGLEGKMSVTKVPKDGGREEKFPNCWVVLAFNFLLCYERFSSEIPHLIVSLAGTKIIKGSDVNKEQSRTIQLLQQRAVHKSVDKCVEDWLGSPTNKKKKKTSTPILTNRYQMFVEDKEYIYELSVETKNLLNLWTTNCRESLPWYESRHSG